MYKAIVAGSVLGVGYKVHQYIQNQRDTYNQSQSKRFVEDSNHVNKQRHMESARIAIKKHLKFITQKLNRQITMDRIAAADRSEQQNIELIRSYIQHSHCALTVSCLFQALYAIDAAYAFQSNRSLQSISLNQFISDLIEKVYSSFQFNAEFDETLNNFDHLNRQQFTEQVLIQMNQILIELPNKVETEIRELCRKMFDQMPSSVSYQWTMAIKPQIVKATESNQFGECLIKSKEEIQSVLEHYIRNASESASDSKQVLINLGNYSDEILEFINQFTVDSFALDHLFTRMFEQGFKQNEHE